MHFAGYPAAVDRLRALCDAHGLALIEDAAHAPSAALDGPQARARGASPARSRSSRTRSSPAARAGCWPPTTTRSRRSPARLRSQAMTSGTWSRQTRETDAYDVVGLGFNYRLDEPRSALLRSRLARLEPDIERRRELTRRLPRAAGRRCPDLLVPYDDAGVERSSCYVMPVIVDDDERRDAVRRALRDEHGIQTSRLLSRRPRVHGLPEPLRRAAPAADRARRPHRDHDPAVRPPRRGRRRTGSSTRSREVLG